MQPHLVPASYPPLLRPVPRLVLVLAPLLALVALLVREFVRARERVTVRAASARSPIADPVLLLVLALQVQQHNIPS